MLPNQLLNILFTQTFNESQVVATFWVNLIDSIPLFIHGKSLDGGTDSITLFVRGKSTHASHMNLATFGTTTETDDMNLFLKTLDWQLFDNNRVSLFVEGTPAGVLGIYRDDITAFIEGPSGSGTPNGAMPLSIIGRKTFYSTGAMPLFLKAIGNLDGSITRDSDISLFLKNEWSPISSGVDMFVQGPEGTSGAVSVEVGMNLFMARDSDRIAQSIPLYINGPQPNITDIPLFIEGGQSAESGITGYMYGIITEEGSINVFTRGF